LNDIVEDESGGKRVQNLPKKGGTLLLERK